ncbi:MAG: hypothetical protein IPK82_12800 [Polyangiaceae bacterium]|nr:hypothetical protein [Polyangiaceae bacterium]
MRSFLLFAVFGFATGGCFEPIQGGGVVIVGDPAERLAALCKFHHAGDGEFCAEETAEAPEIGVSESPSAEAPGSVPAAAPPKR